MVDEVFGAGAGCEEAAAILDDRFVKVLKGLATFDAEGTDGIGGLGAFDGDGGEGEAQGWMVFPDIFQDVGNVRGLVLFDNAHCQRDVRDGTCFAEDYLIVTLLDKQAVVFYCFSAGLGVRQQDDIYGSGTHLRLQVE